ncbi:major facilitator superfamily domain-containing protein [Chaetomium strumarium]|uniref:Major facilitator superfamily domain-containing protein n=1 Tax=Chaetomium strumarium TaxID=1170767 RepID=A0AAJ0GVW7_9PEZI|nr:major facilitator superfamily domain-containing protein [Chaetomium strumarium]
MTSTNESDGLDSSRGWSRRTAREDDASGVADEGITETSVLLGAGAQTSKNAHRVREDSWAGTADFDGLPWWKRPTVWFLLAPYALFTLAFGGAIVPRLNLIIDLICRHYFADRSAADPDFTFTPVVPGGSNRQCFIPDVQKQVATFSLVLNVLTGTLSSLTAPKLGSLSDRYGRKRMMIVCSVGGILAEIITILAAKYPETVPYQFLLLGAFFDGLTGSFTAGSVLSHAYTSDCTPPSKRGVAIGYLHSCLFTGLAFGPLIAGYLVKWTGSLLSIFYILLGCHLFFVCFMAFITPESLSRKQQLLAREKYALQQQAFGPAPECSGLLSRIPFGKQLGRLFHRLRTSNPLGPLDILFPTGPGTRVLRRNFLVLAFIDVVVLAAAMSAGTVIVMYVEYIFEWGNFESSRFISLTSMVRVVILVAVLPLINYLFRTRPAARRTREEPTVPVEEKNSGADEVDLWILRAALVSDVVGVVGYILARSGPVFVACAVVTAFGGMGSATIQAAVSKHVPPARVGQMLGAIGLLHSFARIIAPILFNQLYAATVESFPQAIFVLLASAYALALAASFFLKAHGTLFALFLACEMGITLTAGLVYLREEDEPAPARSSSSSDRVRQDATEDEELLLPRV